MMTMFFMVGALYASRSPQQYLGPTGLVIYLMSFLAVQSIYLFNSAGGIEHDDQNDRFSGISFSNSARTKYTLMAFSIVLLISACLISLYMGWASWWLILLDYLIWVAYAGGKLNFKSTAHLGALVHFVSGIINFHVCSIIFQEITFASVSIAAYFSLLFTAGYFHHLVIDHEADLKTGVATFSVRYGKDLCRKISFGIICAAFILYTQLFIRNLVAKEDLFVVSLAFLVNAILYYYYMKGSKNYSSDLVYRRNYRALYFLTFLSVFLINCYKWKSLI